MASAKTTAIKQLGNLDLSYLDKEKEVAKESYDLSKNSLENEYTSFLNTLNKDRATTRSDFNAGRQTVNEDAFMANRNSLADLASRGVGQGGLNQLSKVGNRIETGRQYSDLANTFYDTMEGLDTTANERATSYDTDLQKTLNEYNAALAGIGTRGAEARNAYNQAVASLAEQIQARWDAAAQAKAATKAQEDLALQNALNTNVLAEGLDIDKRVANYKLLYPNATDSQIYNYLASQGLYSGNVKTGGATNFDASKSNSKLSNSWLGQQLINALGTKAKESDTATSQFNNIFYGTNGWGTR